MYLCEIFLTLSLTVKMSPTGNGNWRIFRSIYWKKNTINEDTEFAWSFNIDKQSWHETRNASATSFNSSNSELYCNLNYHQSPTYLYCKKKQFLIIIIQFQQANSKLMSIGSNIEIKQGDGRNIDCCKYNLYVCNCM